MLGSGEWKGGCSLRSGSHILKKKRIRNKRTWVGGVFRVRPPLA